MTLEVNFFKTSMCSLASQISMQPANGRTFSKSTFCKLCNILRHPIDKCTCFVKKCHNCNNFGHEEASCCFEKITHKYKSSGNNGSGYRGKRWYLLQFYPHFSTFLTHVTLHALSFPCHSPMPLTHVHLACASKSRDLFSLTLHSHALSYLPTPLFGSL